MPSAFDKFIQDNTKGPLNKVFLAGYLADIGSAENKTKAILRMVRDLALFRITWPVALATGFTAMQKIVRTILYDTGSLQAALTRLSNIQGFQRAFTPLLGGLDAAKQRVAQLLNLSQGQKVFKFEDVAEANRNLETLTKGAFSGNEAMRELMETAATSGQPINVVTGAIGDFYAKLNAGEPIGAAAEQLRQLGVINNTTAQSLQNLQNSGAGAVEIFSALRGGLVHGGGATAGSDVAAVTSAHAAAAENLQTAFGQGFTDKDVQNTKNWTDAMNAIAPSVSRVSTFISNLTNGLSTVRSTIAKTAAESPALQKTFEGIAKGGATLIAILAAFGIGLLTWRAAVFAFTGSIAGLNVGLGALGITLRALSAASGIGLLIYGIVQAIGIFTNFRETQRKLVEETERLTKAHRESQAALNAQIAAIETLADRHDALAAALQHVIELEEERRKFNQQFRSNDKQYNPKAAAENERALMEADAKLQELLGKSTAGLTSPQQVEFARTQAQRSLRAEEEAFQRKMATGSPEGRVELLRNRATVLRQREQLGQVGARATIDTEKLASDREKALITARQDLDTITHAVVKPEEIHQAAIRAAQRKVTTAEAGIAQAGLQAPAGTSTRLETEARLIQYSIQAQAEQARGNKEAADRLRTLAGGVSGTPAEVAMKLIQAEQARVFEQQTDERSKQLDAERVALEREQDVTRLQQDREVRARELRRKGDVGGAVQLEDLGKFADQFERFKQAGFSEDESRTRALKQSRSDIQEEVLNRPAVVESLQRIGLGGAIGATDPSLDAQRRMQGLQEAYLPYLKQIAEKKEEPAIDEGFFF